ncbi:MAG: hypothetical protein AMXMBFR13_49710 [Phycisphaerae bacterium]
MNSANNKVEQHRARTILYATLATGFRYPDPVVLDELAALGQQLSAVTAEGLNAEESAVFSRCSLTGEPVSLDALEADHVRLFGYAVRGSCPPYELEYGRSEIIQQAAMLADITGFYHAFGLEPDEAAHERPDHLCTQCEFLSVLAARQAHAIEVGDPEGCTRLHDAGGAFLAEHLAQWLPAFVHRVRAADGGGFYGRLATLAAQFIDAECRRFDIRSGPELLELRPADPSADMEMACGPEESCPGGSDALVQVGLDTVSNGQS